MQGYVAKSQHLINLMDYYRMLFTCRCYFIPKCNFLVNILFIPTPLQSSKGIKIIKNLINLYYNDCQNIYYPNMWLDNN